MALGCGGRRDDLRPYFYVETGGVTDMSRLFSSDYNAAAVKFNDDISAWDTSSVTDMREMFR